MAFKYGDPLVKKQPQSIAPRQQYNGPLYTDIGAQPTSPSLQTGVSDLNNITEPEDRTNRRPNRTPVQQTLPQFDKPVEQPVSEAPIVEQPARQAPTSATPNEPAYDSETATFTDSDGQQYSMAEPPKDFVSSRVGNPANYGTSMFGIPLTSPAQYKATKDATELLSKLGAGTKSKLGEQILNGDYSAADSIPSTKGLPGKSSVQLKLEFADLHQWGSTNVVELPGASFNDVSAGAFSAGLKGGVAGGTAGATAGLTTAIPTGGLSVPVLTGIGTGGGILIGTLTYVGNYLSNVDSKEEFKDIREAFKTLQPIIAQLNDEGFTEEADLIMRELEKTLAIMDNVGEYGKQYELTYLVNEAQDITAQGIKADITLQKIISEREHKIENTEYMLSTGQIVSDADIEFAAKNGSTVAQGALADAKTTQLNNELVKQQGIMQNKLVTKSTTATPDEIVNDSEWVKFVSDPNNSGTLAYKIYVDAQQDIQDAKELEDKRAYDAYLDSKDREQQLADRDEARAYSEEQARLQQEASASAAFMEESTATEASGSSTLSFGLLSSSGDTQFVDRDAASTAYFGKVYEELTPAQKRLLMLSKGK